jgi:flagellar biosynthesis/type III secretory pathway protein FliH
MDAKKLNNQEKLDHMFEMVNELNHEMHEIKKKEASQEAYKLFYMTLIVIAMAGVYLFVSPLFEVIKKAPEVIDSSLKKIENLKSSIPDQATMQKTAEQVTEKVVNVERIKQGQLLLETAERVASSTSR